MPRQPLLPGWAAGLDAPQGKARPVGRPAPRPPADQRPKKISVTAVDKLKADPYEFYAKHILRLVRRDPVDVDPSAADRGNAMHAIMEAWVKEIGRAWCRERVWQSV